jgi:hypothetical protein
MPHEKLLVSTPLIPNFNCACILVIVTENVVFILGSQTDRCGKMTLKDNNTKSGLSPIGFSHVSSSGRLRQKRLTSDKSERHLNNDLFPMTVSQ